MITLPYELNLYPASTPITVHVSQYDSDFSIVFTLVNTHGTFTLESGTTAEIRGTKKDGNGYSKSATINISAKTVTIQGDEQMTAVAGANTYELALLKGSKVLHTANFVLMVERAALDADTIQSETVLKELNAIIAGAAEATQAAEDASDAADRAEAAAQTLEIDATLTHSGQAADAKAVGDAVDDLRDDLSITEPITYIVDHYVDLHVEPVDINNLPTTTNPGEKCAVVSCSEGDKFIINAVGGGWGRAWGFLDSSNMIISKADGNATVEGLELIAPQNSATLVINDHNDLTSYKVLGFITDVVKNLNDEVIELDNKITNLDDVKVDKQQSATDAGKALIVGSDGVIIPEEIDIPDGLSDSIKVALLNCFQHVAWVDAHGQDYYDVLETALYADSYPRITAVFNAGVNVIYTDDTLDTLKQYLTVKYYTSKADTGTTIPSANYTLSGVLNEGENAIRVVYNTDYKTTFIVNAIDFYNKKYWSLSSGQLKITEGGINGSNNKALLPYYDDYPRRRVNTERGTHYPKGNTSYTDDELNKICPIPIPAGTSQITITISPSTIYANAMLFGLENGVYTNTNYIAGSGLGSISLNFTSHNFVKYLSIAMQSQNGRHTFDEPTEIIVQCS